MRSIWASMASAGLLPSAALRRRGEDLGEAGVVAHAREIGVGTHLLAIGDPAGGEGAREEIESPVLLAGQGIGARGVVPRERGNRSEVASLRIRFAGFAVTLLVIEAVGQAQERLAVLGFLQDPPLRHLEERRPVL